MSLASHRAACVPRISQLEKHGKEMPEGHLDICVSSPHQFLQNKDVHCSSTVSGITGPKGPLGPLKLGSRCRPGVALHTE